MMSILLLLAFALVALLFAVLFRSDIALGRIRSQVERGHYDRALAVLERMTRKENTAAASLWFQALALEGLGRFDKALETLKRIPLTDTRTCRFYSSLDILSRLAELCEKTGEHFEAVKYLALLRDRGFDSARLRFLFARNFFKLKDYAKSLHYLREALRKNPRHAEALVLTGRIFYGTGQYQAAVEELKKVMRIDPRHPEAGLFLGLSYYRQGLYAKASGILKKSVPSPEFWDERSFCLGSALFHASDFAGAFSHLERLASLEASSAVPYKEVFYRLAVSAERIGKFQEAAEYWKFLAGRDPRYLDTEHRNRLAQAYQQSEAFKVFLFSPLKRFHPLAGLMLKEEGFRTIRMEPLTDRILDVLAEKPGKEGEVEKIFFRFVRSADPVDRKVLQILHERMRDGDCRQGVLFSAGPVLPEASSADMTWPIALRGYGEILRLAEKVFGEYKKYG